MKRRITILLFASMISGGCLSAAGDGGQAGAFLRYGVGVRALGMGRAFVAVSDDASSVYWNPAGMLGADRSEAVSMYSNLFYDSRYAFLGITVPRLLNDDANPWLRWFLGPGTAWGMGWVGLSMAGFEQRSAYNEYLGQFDMGENGWLLSWARETVGSFGVVRYGLTYKLVNQQFSGLNTSAMPVQGIGTDWSGGLDAGLTFQPIHMPIFRVIALKYLLPLRFGLNIQNLIQPGWEGTEGGRQAFPIVFRYGASYRVLLKDWLPEAWDLNEKLNDAAVLLALDREQYSGADAGLYFGVEGQIPVRSLNIQLHPRLGINNRTENRALGFGLSVPFAAAILKMDYVNTAHPDMGGDTRFSLSVQFSTVKDAGFFRSKARQASMSREMLNYNHLVLSKYPNDYIDEAVGDIASTADRPYEKRLYALVGGMRHAELLLEDANLLLKEKNIQGARTKALESARAYAPNYLQDENLLSDAQMSDYGEALLISGKMQDAVTVLEEVGEKTLRSNYLLGAGYQGLASSRAIDRFDEAVHQVREDQVSMTSLAYLGLAEALVRDGQYTPAQTALSSLLNFERGKLNDDYPHFPIFEDQYIQDDAMVLMGITQLLNKEYDRGVSTLFKTVRYFPGLVYGAEIDAMLDELSGALNRGDFTGLDEKAKTLLVNYYIKHNPSNQYFE